MDNINDYTKEAEAAFKERFSKTEIYKKLVNDFDSVVWAKSQGAIMGEVGTSPRKQLAERTFTAVTFYYLEKLLEVSPDKIYDLGCAENMFKAYIPNLIGVDSPVAHQSYRHNAPDIDAIVDDDFVANHQEAFESVFSICALHFHSITKLEKIINDFISMVKVGGRGFIALNTHVLCAHASAEENLNLFGTENPISPVHSPPNLERYIRNILSNIKCNYLILDVDLSPFMFIEQMNGNIRIVFERTV